ncbi:MAG: hypothetical protein WDM79_04965 [Terricaulis sp.]
MTAKSWELWAAAVGVVTAVCGVLIPFTIHLDERTNENLRDLSVRVDQGNEKLSVPISDIRERVARIEGGIAAAPTVSANSAARSAGQDEELRALLARVEATSRRLSALEQSRTTLGGQQYLTLSSDSYRVFVRPTESAETSLIALNVAAADYFRTQGQQSRMTAAFRTFSAEGREYGCVESPTVGEAGTTVAFCAPRQGTVTSTGSGR